MASLWHSVGGALRALCNNWVRCVDWSAMETIPTPLAVELAPAEDAVVIVDQTLLPGELRLIELRELDEMYDAIKLLKVRGAPAIGVCAAYCAAVRAGVLAAEAASEAELLARLETELAYLESSRPTAVNLAWALARMRVVAKAATGSGCDAIVTALVAEARTIDDENRAMSDEISRLGATLINDGDGILTHCNAGPLACMGFGTGQGPLYYAHDEGKHIRVFADETRPLLQGARLTSWELSRAGIDVTLICDNMASIVMRQGWVQCCMVGCDRVAANGDVANKIGTSGVAILAKHYGIPFYVLGPTSTIDMNCATGDDIPIELREADEIAEMFYAKRMAPEGVACYNPSFDVTPHELVTAIVTERGICYPPYTESLAKLFE